MVAVLEGYFFKNLIDIKSLETKKNLKLPKIVHFFRLFAYCAI